MSHIIIVPLLQASLENRLLEDARAVAEQEASQDTFVRMQGLPVLLLGVVHLKQPIQRLVSHPEKTFAELPCRITKGLIGYIKCELGR